MGHNSETGHIFAPVSVADVNAILVANSLDVATLCTYGGINPHSLIRPLRTTDPAIGPEHFEKTGPNVQYAGTLAPTTAENAGYQYASSKWGYFVPFVNDPNHIGNIRNVYWKRVYPTDAASFKCLTHFDGYLHFAEPHPHVNAVVEYGKNVVVNFNMGLPTKDVIVSGGTNKGGVVSVVNVLGTEGMKLGCTIYDSDGGWAAVIQKSTIKDTASSEVQGPTLPDEPILVAFDTGYPVISGLTYTVIPWVTDGDINDEGIPIVKNNIHPRFFNLQFSELYDSVTEVVVEQMFVRIGDVQRNGNAFTITFTSTYEDTQSLRDIKVNYILKGGGKNSIQLTGTPSLNSKTVNGGKTIVTMRPATGVNIPDNSACSSLYLTAIHQGTGKTLMSKELVGSWKDIDVKNGS